MNNTKEAWNNFREALKDREYQKKLAFSLLDCALMITLIMSWLFYVFTPVMKEFDIYQKSKYYDPIVGFAVLGFVLFSLWFVIGPLPGMIRYSIVKTYVFFLGLKQ